MVGLDIAGPLVVFWLARAGGVPVVWALVLSGLPPLLMVGWDWVQRRTLDVVGGVVLGGIVLSIALAFLSADPRVVLLEGVALTAAFGAVCLVSVRARRPLVFHFAQAFYGGPHARAGQELDRTYAAYGEARSFWRTLTVVWGVVYLVESAARVVVIFVAATSTALLVNRLLPWCVYAVLLIGSFAWGNRLRSSEPADSKPDA